MALRRALLLARRTPDLIRGKAGWRCLRVSIPFLQLERLES
jgi:hypothetical protein